MSRARALVATALICAGPAAAGGSATVGFEIVAAGRVAQSGCSVSSGYVAGSLAGTKAFARLLEHEETLPLRRVDYRRNAVVAAFFSLPNARRPLIRAIEATGNAVVVRIAGDRARGRRARTGGCRDRYQVAIVAKHDLGGSLPRRVAVRTDIEPPVPDIFRFTRYSAPGLSFLRPSWWRPYSWVVPLRGWQKYYLSTEPLHDPCVYTKTDDGAGVSCGWPLERMRRSGVVVSWSHNSGPVGSVAELPGDRTKVGGKSAIITVARPGACASIHADETITVSIAGSLSFMACLREPGVRLAERQFERLLGSLRF